MLPSPVRLLIASNARYILRKKKASREGLPLKELISY
jgi:hypothetical protein